MNLSSLIRFLWSRLFLSFNWVGGGGGYFFEKIAIVSGGWVDEHGRPCLRPFRGSLPLTCSFYSSTTLGGASVLHHWLTCPFYSSTTGGQEPNTLVLALCTLHRWIYLHLQCREAVKQNGGGCDHQWCEVGNSGTLRSTMMAPNDAKKRVAWHYLFLRIKRTTVNGVLLKPTKPNNVKTNQNKTR